MAFVLLGFPTSVPFVALSCLPRAVYSHLGVCTPETCARVWDLSPEDSLYSPAFPRAIAFGNYSTVILSVCVYLPN